MKSYKHILILLILSNAFLIAGGQNGNSQHVKKCPIKTLNYETGLLNNSTTNEITDALGFTWISTSIGLQRFNGNRLETIQPVINNDTLSINGPVYLFNLRNGLMWISYKNYVLEYNPFRNTFRKVITLASMGNSFFKIVPLKETHEGIWCMQEKKGIVIYNTEGKITRTFSFYNTATINDIISSEDLLYKTIIAANSNYIFIADENNHILKINTAAKKFSIINCKSGLSSGLTCTANNLFVFTNGKLLIINIHDGQIKKKVLIKKINNEIVNNNELSLGADGLLLVSVNNHLYEFDTTGNYKDEITDLNRDPVVNAGFINKIYPDKFKRIWLLSNDNIIRIQNAETPFVHFIYPDTKNNFVRSLYYDEQKHVLLAGCFNGGLQLYDTLANPLWKEPLITKDVKDILSIEKLSSDEYLIVTYGNGWYLLTLSTRQIRPFVFPPALKTLVQPKQLRFTNNLQRIDDSTILIATGKNIFRFIFDKTKIKSAVPLLALTNNFQNEVDCFLYAKDTSLWVGTSTGILYRLDKNHHAETFTIPGNYIVRTITEDALHNIWVGTDKGLYIYSKQGQLIKKITTETGLLNDCIYSLLPLDKNDAVFASSNLGISFISLQGIIKNYSRELGLQDAEFNTASCVKTKSGKLYFGGVDGITSFYPQALSVIKDTPGIFITRLVINDVSRDFPFPGHKGDSILLNYSQNHLQLDITAMGLLNPDEYIYKYRLRGFQNQWEVTHQPNNINYILPPGKYVLEIICSPNLSTNVFFKKNIIIIIDPPWWQTWWFVILAVFFSISVIALIVHLYNRNKFKQKIKFLQAKNEMQQERERISRDLHDNLGAQANVLLFGTEQLQNLNTSESILVSNLHTTAKEMMHSLRETIWVMKHHDAAASEIWFRIVNFCKQLSLFYKEIKITAEGELSDKFVFNSEKALHIILIVQEALNNAVRHSDAKNIITESIIKNNTWIINVKDDGKGIMPKDTNETSGGFGLNNMKERALIAEINVIIESNVGTGTCIGLHIPLKKINNPK